MNENKKTTLIVDTEKIINLYKNNINDLYNKDFFSGRIGDMRSWEIKVGAYFVRKLKIKSVVDFGCSIGSFLEGAMESGATVKGFEYAYESAKPYIPKKVGKHIEKGNVGQIINCGSFDLAMSVEVAEHILPEESDNFVENLTKSATKFILLTAAPPTQRGSLHINLQTYEFWLDKITSKGWLLDNNTIEEMRMEIPKIALTPKHLRRNLMLFRK